MLIYQRVHEFSGTEIHWFQEPIPGTAYHLTGSLGFPLDAALRAAQWSATPRAIWDHLALQIGYSAIQYRTQKKTWLVYDHFIYLYDLIILSYPFRSRLCVFGQSHQLRRSFSLQTKLRLSMTVADMPQEQRPRGWGLQHRHQSCESIQPSGSSDLIYTVIKKDGDGRYAATCCDNIISWSHVTCPST